MSVIWKLYLFGVFEEFFYLATVPELTGALKQDRLRQLSRQMYSCMSLHLHANLSRHCEGWMLVVLVVGPVGLAYGVIHIPQGSVLEVAKPST